MTKNKIGLGMLVIVPVFAMTLLGCAGTSKSSKKGSGRDAGKSANMAALSNTASLPALYSAEQTLIIPAQVLLAATEQPGQTEQIFSDQPSQAERIFRAMAEAYPDRVGEVAFRKADERSEADWAIQIYGEWFYYAEGRFLPASLRNKAADYDPLPFDNYPEELPPWRAATAEESERMRQQVTLRNSRPVKRSPHFLDALWRSRNRDDAWEHVKQIRFLGKPVLVHNSILTNLSLVEEQILRVAKSNTAVRQWVNSITTVEGWNWRNIAMTESRSFHSYGAAIDLLPKSLGRLETYWGWAARNNSEWWNIPYTRRYHPPNEVVKIFESFGFIWGGKWDYFDTMHFEYRPELLVLNDIPRMDLRNLR